MIRGGIGKFYEYTLVGVANTLNRFGVYSQTFTFQTNEDTSADRGQIPTSHVCLQPSGSGGVAAISPACRAFLTNIRNSLQPGAGTQFVNTEPQLDGDRRLGYLWEYSVGVKHELWRDWPSASTTSAIAAATRRRRSTSAKARWARTVASSV